jgi:hypothetical protein
MSQVPRELLPRERASLGVLGLDLPLWSRRVNLSRPFMARLGDITRIEPRGKDLWITLKSGTAFHLNRYAADDLADGVRIWVDSDVVDLEERRIRSIDLLAAPALGAASGPVPLYGTVHTPAGQFTGFVQWNREQCLGSDQLVSRTPDGAVSLRFDSIRSIARPAGDSTALVTQLDGREIVLFDLGREHRGIYVDDPRYGRVLVSWDAFARVEFAPGGTGPDYGDFPPGRPLTGSVLTRSGRRLDGRLIYDLDESETTETLDAPAQGIDYTIPFDLISAIALPGPDGPREARVILQSGEELRLELAGDLGAQNGGMLIVLDGGQGVEYVRWTDVQQIDIHGSDGPGTSS